MNTVSKNLDFHIKPYFITSKNGIIETDNQIYFVR